MFKKLATISLTFLLLASCSSTGCVKNNSKSSSNIDKPNRLDSYLNTAEIHGRYKAKYHNDAAEELLAEKVNGDNVALEKMMNKPKKKRK